ncbi:MAG: hypothetical protein ACOYM3_14795 [Terrimicrobiaceae bacterium]
MKRIPESYPIAKNASVVGDQLPKDPWFGRQMALLPPRVAVMVAAH